MSDNCADTICNAFFHMCEETLMIKQISIDRFKSIASATLKLDKINVLVGANNAGKSSVLQALQFTTSVAQTAKLYSQSAKGI